MEVQSVLDHAEFKKIVAACQDWLVVVHFWAPWAPQCEQMNEVLSELAKDTRFVNCKFLKVEAEAVPEISQQYNVAAVPTCVLLRRQQEIDRVEGANVPELMRKVERLGAHGAAIPQLKAQPKQDLNARLGQLVKQSPVMVFIKGMPEEPRCGFSRQLVDILKSQNVKFGSFDILSDEDVRQGLKKFSDWPTYPQVYVDGELIGGLDIIKEMVENGEFKDAMPKQESLEDRLKSLVNQEPVMLFMKGSPDNPKCGFSRSTCEILKGTGVKYGHFDILEDNEVRQGLKTYSDWPTFPQLYVKGELIGGLDIIKEMQETGDLNEALKS